MSESARKAVKWLRGPKKYNLIAEEDRIDQAADEKYRPLVEAAEKMLLVCEFDDIKPNVQGHAALLREALKKVKE